MVVAGKREQAAADLRARLLDAADELLASHRPGAITSREIARTAGVSDGVLYNHYADKHDLLLAALLRRFQSAVDTWLGAPQPGSATPIDDGLRELAHRAHELHLATLPMLANLAGDPPLLARFLTEIHQPPLGGPVFSQPFVTYLKAARDAGRLGPVDVHATAEVIVGSVLLQGLIDVLGHRPHDAAAAHLDAAVAVLHTGLHDRRSP